MTTVATCSNDAEAMLLKSVLEANEIPVYVPDELTTQSALHFAGSGIRVIVDDENADAARRIIDEAAVSGEADDEAADDNPSPHA